MEWGLSILGVVVGTLVGLTGMGGGALMTPLLILLGGVAPHVAVGTDLVWGALTKAVGASIQYRQGTVNLPLVRDLAYGSLPGTLLGALVVGWIRQVTGTAVLDQFIKHGLGVALGLVGFSLLYRSWRSPKDERAASGPVRGLPMRVFVVALGAGVGFLVSLTSVGSGSLIAASLAFLYPAMPVRYIVGTDIFHGALLVGTAGLAHWGLGSVDSRLLVILLAGSLPGVWLGSRLSARFQDRIMRPIIGTVLLGIGYKLF